MEEKNKNNNNTWKRGGGKEGPCNNLAHKNNKVPIIAIHFIAWRNNWLPGLCEMNYRFSGARNILNLIHPPPLSLCVCVCLD